MPRQNCNSMAVFAVTVYSVFTNIMLGGCPAKLIKKDVMPIYNGKIERLVQNHYDITDSVYKLDEQVSLNELLQQIYSK